MAKYDPLTDRLARETADSLTLGFEELDRLVDGLPPGARQHRAYWANDRTSPSRHSQSWMDAGWRVDRVDLSSEKVTFARGALPENVSGTSQRTIPGTRRTFGDAIEYEMAEASAYSYNDRSGLYHVTGCGHGTELMRSVPRDEVVAAWHKTPDIPATDRLDQQWCNTCIAVRAKSEAGPDGVRRDLLLRAMFDVVGTAEGPLPSREVMEQVRDALDLNEVELSKNNSGQERFNTFIGFASGWATNAVGSPSIATVGPSQKPAGPRSMP